MDDSTTSTETWKDIPGHLGYQVSDQGRVRSRWKTGYNKYLGDKKRLDDKWHIKKFGTTKEGHQQVHLKRCPKYVHRLMLEIFVGPCPEGMECCHEDDDPTNNVLSNLSWGTRLKNMADRSRNGRVLRGEAIGNAKITNADAIEIRRRAALGEKYASIAKDYPLSVTGISNVSRGYTFAHLPGAIPARMVFKKRTSIAVSQQEE